MAQHVTPHPRRRFGRSAKLAAVAFAAFVALVELRIVRGFLPPPALMEASAPDDSLDSFPRGAELVETRLPNGQVLRGVWVPSDPGAPLVLHLLESSGCALAGPIMGYRRCLRGYSDLGFASLMLDYRGVGRSDGSRSTRNIEGDAWAMWNAALERAGGDSSLIIVRGVSIGALAAATLMERGVEPAAWILIDPLRADTTVENFVRDRWGRLAARLASPFFEPIVSVELEDVLERVKAPLHVISAKRDRFITTTEQERLHARVEAAGGEWRWNDASHENTAWGARGTPDAETAPFVRALFPGWPEPAARAARVWSELTEELQREIAASPPAKERLGDLATWSLHGAADKLAMAALAGLDDAHRVADLARSGWPCQDLEWRTCVALLDLSDPAGTVPIEAVDDVYLSLVLRTDDDTIGCVTRWPGVVELAQRIERAGLDGERTVNCEVVEGPQSLPIDCEEILTQSGWTEGEPTTAIRRRMLRGVLKAFRLPERVVEHGDDFALEVLHESEWIRVDLDWPLLPPQSKPSQP